ncbi:uncharacterized protein OCT59_020710 [Rhizophagus irregularis]|uniref:uncharacterized protein n=1 Tax=Rhizophagus irregularis TaxID=588596 RepID=UPI0033327F56|nr:hypothetical protein OCT59_020710 [Rhizophagus irregularis]
MDKSHIEALAINIVSKANALPSSSENTSIPKVDPCPICGNDIYTLELSVIKEFTLASCGHIFHQKCLKEYLVDGESSCPYDGCNRDIETFLSWDLLKGLQNQTAPIDVEVLTEESTNQKKRSSEFASEKDSNKKAKQTRKQIDRDESPTLKKLIMELTSPESQEDGLSRDSLITLQSRVSEMDVNSLDFLDLYNKIGTAEDNLRRTFHDLLRCYYIFGQATKQLFDHFRKTCNEDASNAKVNDRIMNQISVQDKLTETNLRKRKERGKKVFRLFSNVGGIEAIERLKSFNATTILNLSQMMSIFLLLD